MVKTYTNEEVIQKLRDAAGWKGASKLAAKAGVSNAYLSAVMNGKANPGPKILAVIGLRAVIIQEDKNNSCNAAKAAA